MPSGTYEHPDKKHLFVVCSNVCDKGFHLIVSITGWTNNLCDPTTRLQAGDHPFIRKDSYVFYRKARVEPAASLTEGVASGQFLTRDPMDEKLVTRISAGICSSLQTPKKVKVYAGCPKETAQ
jgi:hypothetical protein